MRNWFRSSDIRTKRAHIARIITNLSIGSGMGEEVKSIPLKTAATPSPESSPTPPLSASPVPPPPRSYHAQRKIVSSDEEEEEEKGGSSPSLSTLGYKLKNTAKAVPVRPAQRLTPVQTRADKILNAGLKTYSKRKNNEKWVTTKCRTSPRRTNQTKLKSIFSSSPTKLFSDHSNMSKFNVSTSDDKFYNLSFDALKKVGVLGTYFFCFSLKELLTLWFCYRKVEYLRACLMPISRLRSCVNRERQAVMIFDSILGPLLIQCV